ncbi:hypothetical protein TSUD_156910 [Trifolium subterraneum]|uniref:Uncharacterized protein n=1 Tax=Trifolium subterraneum TaxID=3900 RepID=A0A2Z6M7U3_TRISU|nr:hypothetical protein TSUD_156910 [Trifolium subterraneum]
MWTNQGPIPTKEGHADQSATSTSTCSLTVAHCANYMTWYMNISHPYFDPLPPGNPVRPVELDVVVQDEANVGDKRTIDLVVGLREI